MRHEPLPFLDLDDASPGRFYPPLDLTGRDDRRPGLLPIETNLFDRVFISAVCLVAVHLVWLRFIESYLPIWIATGLTLILTLVILRRG